MHSSPTIVGLFAFMPHARIVMPDITRSSASMTKLAILLLSAYLLGFGARVLKRDGSEKLAIVYKCALSIVFGAIVAVRVIWIIYPMMAREAYSVVFGNFTALAIFSGCIFVCYMLLYAGELTIDRIAARRAHSS